AVEVLRVDLQLPLQCPQFGGLRLVARGSSAEGGRTDRHGPSRGRPHRGTTAHILHRRTPSRNRPLASEAAAPLRAPHAGRPAAYRARADAATPDPPRAVAEVTSRFVGSLVGIRVRDRKSASRLGRKFRRERIMAAPQFTPEELDELRALAAQW